MLPRLISPLRSLARRPVSDWCLLAEAVGILIWSKIQLYVSPFSQLAEDLGTQQAETLKQVSEDHRAMASKISWAVQTGARYVRLRLVCLPQAMAASTMLSRRGIDSTLYLGVKIDQTNAFTAHAWLRTGLKWVTGGAARHGQSVVACFAKIETTPVSWTSRFRLLIAVSVIGVVAVLTLMPTPPLYDFTWQDSPGWLRDPVHTVGSHDYWFNFVGFALANLIFNFSLYGIRRAPIRYRWQAVLFFTGIITVLECMQLSLPERNFDLMDIVASVLATWAITLLWVRASSRA